MSAVLSQLRAACGKHGLGQTRWWISKQSSGSGQSGMLSAVGDQRGRFSWLPHSFQVQSWADLNGCGLAGYLSIHMTTAWSPWACVWRRDLRMVIPLTQMVVLLGLGTKSECAQRPKGSYKSSHNRVLDPTQHHFPHSPSFTPAQPDSTWNGTAQDCFGDQLPQWDAYVCKLMQCSLCLLPGLWPSCYLVFLYSWNHWEFGNSNSWIIDLFLVL